MKEKRLSYIDMAKGIALLLVIFGHTFRESMREAYFWCDFSYLFVYKFHVPLFFLISGICYGITEKNNTENSLLKYLKKKGKSVLLPWFSYSALIYIVFTAVAFLPVMGDVLEDQMLPHKYLYLMLRNENPYAFHLWFLSTLFIFLAVTFLQNKYIGKSGAQMIKIIMILALPLAYNLWAREWIWTVKAVLQQFPYFLMGTMIKKDLIENNPKKLTAIGLACGIGIGIFTYFENSIKISSLGWIGIDYAKYIAVSLLSLGIISACYLIGERVGLLAELGRNSMMYYLYHQPFCCAFLGIVLYEKLGLSAIAVVLCCMTASVIIPFAVSRLARVVRLDKILSKVGFPI